MKSSQMPYWVGAVALALGLVGTAWMASSHERNNRELAQARFETLAKSAIRQVVTQVRGFEYGLRGARGVAAAQEGLPSLATFRRYAATRDIEVEFPGARGFGLIWRVPADREAAFVAQQRSQGREDFALKQLAPSAGERYVITYIEPEAANRQAVGQDVASESRRREAAETAMRTGRAAITEPITLVQASGKRARAFLILLPVHASGQPQGPAAVAGWSYAPVLIDEVLGKVQWPQEQLWVEWRDSRSQEGGTFFQSPGEMPRLTGQPTTRVVIDIFNRQWEAHVVATPSFVRGLGLMPTDAVWALGILLSLLLGSLGFLSTQRTQRARALGLEQARRAAIVNTTDDGIVVVSPQGVVSEWNPGAERLFGHSAEEAIGRSLLELVVPGADLAEDERARQTVLAGERCEPREVERRHRSGHLVDVSVSMAPVIDARGRRVAVAQIFRDIRQAKSAQRAMLGLNATLESQVALRTEALEAERRDKAALLDTIMSHALFSITDRAGTIIEVNQRFCQVSGYHVDELVGQTHRLINSGCHGPEFWREMWRTVARGKPWRGEVCNRAKDGSLYWVDSVIAPHLDAAGRIERIVSFRIDITETKRLQQVASQAWEQAERSEAFLRDLTDRLPMSLAYLDASGAVRFANAGFCQRVGLSRDQLVGQPAAALAARPGGQGAQDLALLVAPPGQHELVSDGEPGERRHYGYLVADDVDAAGAARGRFVIGKRAEQEMRRTLAVLRSVLSSATRISIVAVDRQGKIEFFNRGAEALLGYSADEAVGGMSAMDWHLPEELEARAQALSQQLGRTVPASLAMVVPEALNERFDCHFRRKDGGLVPVSLTVSPIRDDEGRTLGYIGVAYDISDRLAYEQGLRGAVAAAEAANQAKSSFLANMSHEIRTPLNAVIGLAHLLERTPLNPEQATFAQNIRLAGKSLLSVVNDVLDVSKIEAGEMLLERIDFSLRDLVSELRAVMGAQATAKRLEMGFSFDADVPELVRGDPTRLRQVLMNLLGNALKFTERGRIDLRLSKISGDTQACRLRFEVSDTGVGIPADVQDRLFTPFAQADASTTRRFGGTGLGLSIVRQLVEHMGGRVGVDSALGVGSCFWAELPFGLGDMQAFQAARGPAPAAGERLAGVKVLLVDDSPINLQVAGRLLEMDGAHVSYAAHGQEALDRLTAGPDVDLVLMDVQMPGMDGLEATRRLHAMPQFATLPVLALTAGSTADELGRAREAGMLDVLSKPIDPPRLLEAVARVVRRPLAAPVPAAAASSVTTGVIGASGATAWPEIDGFDTVAARPRFLGDVSLFDSMVQRMLELGEGALSLPGSTEAERSQLAAQMHSLKGSASTVGATRLAQLALQLEELARRSSGPEAPAALEPTKHQLREELVLRRAAIDAERQTRPQRSEEAATGPDTTLSEPDRCALQAALRINDLQALELYRRFKLQIKAQLPPTRFAALDEHVRRLEFEQAADLLDELA